METERGVKALKAGLTPGVRGRVSTQAKRE